MLGAGTFRRTAKLLQYSHLFALPCRKGWAPFPEFFGTSSHIIPWSAPRIFSTLPTLKQTLTPPLLSPDSLQRRVRPLLDVDSRSFAVPWTLGVVAATAVCNSPGMISVHYRGPFHCPDLIFQVRYLHVLSCSYVVALSHTNSFSSAIVRP